MLDHTQPILTTAHLSSCVLWSELAGYDLTEEVVLSGYFQAQEQLLMQLEALFCCSVGYTLHHQPLCL
jgi:hypothetical protein